MFSVASLREKQGLPPEPTADEKKEGKKKKKSRIFLYLKIQSYQISFLERKKKKKRSLDDIPPFGPFVTKIHLFDNEIDCLQPNGFAIIQQTIEAYARFVHFF